MGRTHTKKAEARAARLLKLPTSERLLKSSLIKKKEGRVLDASEKHALKMSSEQGEILRLWEKLRMLKSDDKIDTGSSPAEKVKNKKAAYAHKYPIVGKLLHLIEPSFANNLRTPSISRVVQSIIKYGSDEQVGKVIKWILKDFNTNCTDAYAHFVVKALIRHASHNTFNLLFTHFIPFVSRLVLHKFGIDVIHSMYSSRWCKATSRDLLLLAVFRDNMTVMKQWRGYPVLEDVIQQNPSIQKRLLTRLFELGDKLVSQKEAVGYPFVQRLVHAFVRYGTRDEVSELCATLRPYLAIVALTREGAPLASLAFALTDPPKRKDILRSFSVRLNELSTSKYSAPVVARLFDLLYDQQLLHKYVLKDLPDYIRTLINSPYGYLILLHLLTPHQDRKEKLLPSSWASHNLFSMENAEWNHHTWLTPNYKEEVIEFCSKPALNSHLASLSVIAESFLKVLAKEDLAAPKLNRHHIGVVARELLKVVKQEPLYQSALHFGREELVLLNSALPASERRRAREDEGREAEEVPPVRRASKRLRTETLDSALAVEKSMAPTRKLVQGKNKKARSAKLLTEGTGDKS